MENGVDNEMEILIMETCLQLFFHIFHFSYGDIDVTALQSHGKPVLPDLQQFL